MFERLVRLDPDSFVPVTAQLTEQVKHLVAQGVLRPGEQLPSVRDLAAQLGINRNTIAKAVDDLERDGYLRTRRGKGVYVVDRPPVSPRGANTARFIDDTLSAARAQGLDLQALVVALLSRSGAEPSPAFAAAGASAAAGTAPTAASGASAVAETAAAAEVSPAGDWRGARPPSGRPGSQARLLLVECNEPQLKQFGQDLREALAVEVDAVLVDELKGWLLRDEEPGSQRLAGYTAVVTTFYHYQEVSSLLAGRGLRVVPVLAEVRQQTLYQLAALPPGTVVGVACVTWSGASNLRAALENAGMRHLQIIQGCTTVGQSLKPLFDRAKVVVSSGIAAPDLDAYRQDNRHDEVELWVEDRRLDPRGLEELGRDLGLTRR